MVRSFASVMVSCALSRGVAVVGGLAICSAAFGQYTGPSAYLSAADSPFAPLSFNSFFLENFEDGALNTLGLSVNGGVIAAPAASTDSVDGDDGAIDGSGTNGRSWYSGNAGSRFSFSFDAVAIGAFPTHAGLVWTDVGIVTSGSFAVGDVSFEAFDATGVSLGILGPATLGDGNFLGATAEDRFFGIVNLGGISRIDIFMSNSTDWEVDHVQYGVIPAPGAALTLTMLGATMLRRRNRA
jgi:hypothetical protein